MDSEIKSLKRDLLNRQAELLQLIEQMRADELSRSSVYRNLENELTIIREQLQKPELNDK